MGNQCCGSANDTIEFTNKRDINDLSKLPKVQRAGGKNDITNEHDQARPDDNRSDLKGDDGIEKGDTEDYLRNSIKMTPVDQEPSDGQEEIKQIPFERSREKLKSERVYEKPPNPIFSPLTGGKVYQQGSPLCLSDHEEQKQKTENGKIKRTSELEPSLLKLPMYQIFQHLEQTDSNENSLRDSNFVTPNNLQFQSTSTQRSIQVQNTLKGSCLAKLSNGLYVHQWLLHDIIDKSYLSDQISQRQIVVDLNGKSFEDTNFENIFSFAIRDQEKFINLGKTIPKDFYKKNFFGCLHIHENAKFYQHEDKMVIKGFLFNTTHYIANESYLQSHVVYQTQILQLLDNTRYFPTIEQEIIVIDSQRESQLIGYFTFVKQPVLSFFQLIKDIWLSQSKKAYDRFSREKLLYYLLQVIQIVSYLHKKGFSTNKSVLCENLWIDPKNQRVKFMSPLITFMRTGFENKGFYLMHKSQVENGLKLISKKEQKLQDQLQVAHTFYQICSIMDEKDATIGKILRDLIEQTSVTQIGVILKKYDSYIFNNEIMFYYDLSLQFRNEGNLRAATETLQVYDIILYQSNQKYQNVRNHLNNQPYELALVYILLGDLHFEFKDLSKSLLIYQKAQMYLSKCQNIGVTYYQQFQEEQEIKMKIYKIKEKLNYSNVKQTKQPLCLLSQELNLKLANVYLQKYDILRAQLCLYKSYKQALRLEGNKSLLLLKPFQLLGKLLKDKGSLVSAKKFFQKALILVQDSDEEQDKLEKVQILTQIAYIDKESELMQNFIDQNQQAIQILESLLEAGSQTQQQLQRKYLIQLSQLYNNVATGYSNQDQFKNSIEYFSKSIEYSKKGLGENHERTINLIINLGYAYLKIEEFRLAIDNLSNGLTQKEKLQNISQSQILNDYIKLGQSYKGIKDYEKAIYYLIHVESQLGKELEYTLSNEQADTHLQDNVKIQEEINFINEELSELYMTIQDYEKALLYINKALHISMNGRDQYSSTFIRCLLMKGFIIQKIESESHEDIKSLVLQTLKAILTNSKLYQVYQEEITEEIFETQSCLDMLIAVCGPINELNNFNSVRGKEKWRMLILENNSSDKSIEQDE